ncbi:MAG: hypothetical protein U9N33_00825 [Campylobacterota bacterium]|nr:hypothetical protein [Campylobacterota bacterium]
MKTYYYVHTGHRIGLDRFRRATAILRMLGDDEITLLCSDFRIAQVAHEFGVAKSVGVDVVRNIPHISDFGDKLIFDSDEANPIMLKDMEEYFSSFLHVEENMSVVDSKYFDAQTKEKTIELSYFFGDDDYSKDLEKNFAFLDGLNPNLLLGFYYFLDYEDMLREKFPSHHETEDYDEVIMNSEVLITASPQAVLENLASGGKPIYIQREDYTDSFQEQFKKLNIPTLQNYENGQLLTILENIENHEYYKLEQNTDKTIKLIKNSLSL